MRKYKNSICSVITSSVTEESQLSAVDGYGLCSVNYPNKPKAGCDSKNNQFLRCQPDILRTGCPLEGLNSKNKLPKEDQ